VKDINCAAVITEKRRAKGVTQEELATHLGVTKASVSKWETGASYPDIELLNNIAKDIIESPRNMLEFRGLSLA